MGGKLIGFGSNQTGGSGSYDRHVYMQNDGRLAFGAWTGQTNLAISPSAYNDGQWHQVVATQGSDGMNLYVDGVLVATNPDTAAQAYDGYWRVGGDTTWNSSSSYFNGTLDEAAVFSTVLSASTVANQYAIGKNIVPNQNPVAAFTSSSSDLTASFDASGSSDPDGTVAAYSWDFSDGTTGTGATPTHSYASPGSYVVQLTVTDNNGGTNSVTHTVTVTAPNVAPVASFTSGSSGLTGSFDASGSSDSDGTIASYAWTFGDGTTGTGVTPTHSYAGGGTYSVGLTVTDNGGATATTTGSITITAPNSAPTAAFTQSSNALTASFDASSSSDSDGSVASYAWDFGDGTTGSGAQPSHSYPTAGSYVVSLVVTDNLGATGSVTHSVTVAAANVPPTAAFSSSVSALTATFDGSGSSDTDGTVSSYAWDFGDSTTGTGVAPSHGYAAAGTYSVTLTVTDNKGATNSVTHPVTVTAPVGPVALATDTFGRTVSGGLGTADLGGPWTITAPSASYSVGSGVAKFSATKAGLTLNGYLAGVSSSDTDLGVTVSTNAAATGTGTYAMVIGRRVATDDYRARLLLTPTGTVQLQLQRTSTTLKSATISGLSYAVGDQLRVRLQVTGTSPTTIQAKVWKVGTTEPAAWQLTTTDSTAALQTAGSIGLATYLASNATTIPLVTSFDDLAATTTGGGAPPSNVAPTAAFTSSAAGLAATFDGSGSSDSDGTIASYAWNFGDGSTGIGATPSHSYGATGTYTVALTVTDNGGATGTVTHTVTVTAPVLPPGAFATDDFTRTVVNGLGSADLGGAWTLKGTASAFSVTGTTALIKNATAGSTFEAYLSSVSSDDTDVQVVVAPQSAITGSSAYLSLIGRRVATTDYRARVVIDPTGKVVIQAIAGSTTLKAVTVSGLSYTAGDQLQLRLQVFGTSPTTVQARVWKVGTTEPSTWQVSTTDSTAGLQTAGSIGIGTYLGGAATTLPYSTTFDKLTASKH